MQVFADGPLLFIFDNPRVHEIDGVMDRKCNARLCVVLRTPPTNRLL